VKRKNPVTGDKHPVCSKRPWYGGLFLLPEFQPIYDFETDDNSSFEAGFRWFF